MDDRQRCGHDAITAYMAWVDAGNGTPEDEAQVSAFRSAVTEMSSALDGLGGIHG